MRQDKECKVTKTFGDAQSGILANLNGETFDLSQIYNLTQSTLKSDSSACPTCSAASLVMLLLSQLPAQLPA